MNTLEFLSEVLAPAGFPCIVIPAPEGKGFWHYPTKSFEEAAAKATELHLKHRDVYFACGTLKQQSTETMRRGELVKSWRTSDNISHWKTFIVDLDIDPANPEKYPSQASAIAHLGTFCRDVGLPIPMLVSSGYGVHVYWVLETAITADLWHQVAVKLKALLHVYGIKQDNTRTSDMTSILRVVGTSNFKRNMSAPVRALSEQLVKISPAKFLSIVVEAMKSLNVTTLSSSVKFNPDMETGLGSMTIAYPPADLQAVTQGCNQMAQFVINHGDVSEPHWYRAMQVAKFCRAGELTGNALIYKICKKRTKQYSDAEIDDKLYQTKDYGPTLCETFEGINPSGCTGCPNRGKIKSPIVLGNDVVQIAKPAKMQYVHAGNVVEVEIPNPPWPFQRVENGGITYTYKNTDGDNVTEVVYEYDIHPIKRMLDEVTNSEIFYFRSWLPKDGWREYSIPAALIYDPKNIAMLLAKRGVLADIKNKDLLVAYLLAYMKHLQTLSSAEAVYAQMGWKNDDTEFVVGDTVYRKDGTLSKIQLDEQYTNLGENFSQKGTLEAWRNIGNVYNQPGFEDFMFAFMMGFGAPCFKFTDYEGAVLSLSGDSGAGKSTALKLIHSIYGAPKHNVLLNQDTNNAKFAVLGAYNNLPVTYDEITNMDQDMVSELCYSITNGRIKQRLNADSSIKSGNVTWRLPVFVTTNRSLLQLLSFRQDNSGEVMRVLERHVSANRHFTLDQATKIFSPLKDNYGHAGPILLSWYVTHLDEAKQLLAGFLERINHEVDAQVSERFWITMCGIAMLGCHVGAKLNLHNYTDQKLFDHCCKIIRDARGYRVDNSKSGANVVTDFLNRYINQVLVVTEPPKLGGLATVWQKPHNGIIARSELTSRRIFVDRTALRAYCTTVNYDFNRLQHELELSRVLLRADAQKRLGEDTEFIAGLSKVWIVDAAHVEMSGAADLALFGKVDIKKDGISNV